MIARLTGLIARAGEDGVVVDVGGVGYLVFCSVRTQRELPGDGETARLLVETHVREDHIHLYGFIDEAERAAFRLLTTVQGVGAKLALAILGVLSPDALAAAILAGDRAALSRADGVGPKLAARIVNELREKVTGLPASLPSLAAARPSAGGDAGASGDAVSVLVNLGYGRSEAYGAVARVAQALGPAAGLDALIRGGLKELAR